MDTLKGAFDTHDPYADLDLYEEDDIEDAGDLGPPLGIGQDERRMQVRAYNFWASLLEDRNYPSIEDLDPSALPDFGPSSVLLDFSTGTENPGIAYLGTTLAAECGAGDVEIRKLSDVPPRSLLSRITDHYLQIIANQAPIGFEAEFVNQAGVTILYRGILLPFSSDDDTIDFIYGVINWKELADARSADELLLEIDQAIEGNGHFAELSDSSDPDAMFDEAPSPLMRKKQALEPRDPLVDWADGPDEEAIESDIPETADLPRPSFGLDEEETPVDDATYEVPLELSEEFDADFDASFYDEEADEEPEGGAEDDVADTYAPLVLGGKQELREVHDLSVDDAAMEVDEADLAEPAFEDFEPMADELEEAVSIESLLSAAPAEAPAGLADLLAAARQQVMDAHALEDRTRSALYGAIGQAWDFAIAASHDHEGFAELLEDAGLAMQARAPMTPVVKLVFGADYDKTRLTEYAAALSHAQRLNIEQGQLADYLATAEGGLKGVVAAERRARREEAGKPEPEKRNVPRASIARKLRKVATVSLAEIAPEGDEFALVMIRRTPEGTVEVLGEVPQDIGMVEKAAKTFI